MSKRSTLAVASMTFLLAAAPAVAQSPTGQSVTATGTAQTRVLPKNRHNNASIVRAVETARKASIGAAISEAHGYAVDYANATGLTLGGVLSISDASPNGFYGPFLGGQTGPFGVNQYCGTVERLIGKPPRPPSHKKPKFKKVHQCLVPRFASISLTVTYSAS